MKEKQTRTQTRTPREALQEEGNVIKTRDDRKLIVIGQDGKVLNP